MIKGFECLAGRRAIGQGGLSDQGLTRIHIRSENIRQTCLTTALYCAGRKVRLYSFIVVISTHLLIYSYENKRRLAAAPDD